MFNFNSKEQIKLTKRYNYISTTEKNFKYITPMLVVLEK